MADLIMIASAKVKAAIQVTSQQLNKDILALQRRNAAKGNLKSGGTIKELILICSNAISSVQDEITKQYGWVIEKSLFIHSSMQTNLEIDADEHLKSILNLSHTHLHKLTATINAPELYQNTSDLLQKSYEQSLVNVSLFLEGEFKSCSNQKIKKIVKFVPDLISKILVSFK